MNHENSFIQTEKRQLSNKLPTLSTQNSVYKEKVAMENGQTGVETNGFLHGEASNDFNRNSQCKSAVVKKYRPKHLTSLKDHEVPVYSREPYIVSGYRFAENITVHQCTATLFTVHNETFNIWSHIIATFAVLFYAMNFFSKHEVIGNPAVYPLICYTICVLVAFIASSGAHLFSCMSWKVRNACFYVDYATISVFTFSAGQAYIFYCRPLDENASIFHKNPYIFLTVSITLSALNMYLSCLSRHRLRSFRFVIRTGMYVVKFLFDISPFISRCLSSDSMVCDSLPVFYFKRQMFLYAISGAVNASRIPERFWPGVFDLLGYSHHIFHVLLAVANFDAFTVFAQDLESRKVELELSIFQPTFFTTFGLLFILAVWNIIVLYWFVNNWLTAEEEELFGAGKYNVIYRKTNYDDETDKKRQ